MKLLDYLHWNDVNTDNLNFFRAMGVESLLVHFPEEIALSQDIETEFRRMKSFVEGHHLELHVLHAHYVPRDKIVHGLPGRDQQIQSWQRVLRAMGAVGVPNTALTFQGIGHFRTSHTTGRGGVTYSTFDLREHMADAPEHPVKVISADRLWENLGHFYEHIIPVAEEAGVRLALHPDDPPIDRPLGGADRIVVSLDNYQRIFDLVPSSSNGMLFCQGCVAEMGEDVQKAIRYIGKLDKIVFVHFRNIRGIPQGDDYWFQEVFLDEGQVDMVESMESYRDIGYQGAIMMDHTPGIPHEGAGWSSRAWSNGYLKALIKAVYR